MLKSALKLGGSIAKAATTKSAPDVLKAGADAVGMASKIAKPKKKQKNRKR
jgi:hypothetical protein